MERDFFSNKVLLIFLFSDVLFIPILYAAFLFKRRNWGFLYGSNRELFSWQSLMEDQSVDYEREKIGYRLWN